MKRNITAMYKVSEIRNDNYVPGSPSELLGMVWPLTREVASLSSDHDAERRLQRHVTNLIRPEG